MSEHVPMAGEATESERREGARAVLLGGWRGVRWTSFGIRPLALIAGLVGLLPTMFGLGAGYGLSVHSIVPDALGFYLACLACGFFLGVGIALVGRLRGSSRREQVSDTPPPWGSRSIPLRSRRRAPGPAQSIEVQDPRHWSDVWLRREARLARWIAGLGLPLLWVALGLGFAAHLIVAPKLAAAIADADADDPSWRVDDLMAARVPVPDEENGALIVAGVIDLLADEDWPPGSWSVPGFAPPPPTELMKVLDRFPPTGSPVRLDEEAVSTLRDALGDDFEAVESARTVAPYRRGFHDLTIAFNPLDTSVRESINARTVSRLLDADAALLAHDGQIDGALASIRAIFGVGRSIGDEPLLVSGMFRIAIETVGRQALCRTLGWGVASPKALAEVQTVLIEDRGDPMLLDQLRGERAMFDAMISRIRDGELGIASLSGGPGEPGRMSSWGQLWFDYQRAVGLEWHNAAVRIARHPAHERPTLAREWRAEFMRTKDGGTLRMLSATVPLLMMPALDASLSAHARNDAEIGASILIVAAERHRLRHGDWPATLGAIDRDILPEPPLDPYTNEPYRMELRDGQILIYSVGPNLLDEHGACDSKTYPKGGPDDFGSNLWDVPLRRQPPPVREPDPSLDPDPAEPLAPEAGQAGSG